MINYLTKPMQTANSYFNTHHLEQPRRMRSGLTEVVTEVVQSDSRAHTFLAGGACALSLLPEIAHIAAGIIATVATLGLSDKVKTYRSTHMYEASKGFINICYIMPLKIMNTNAKVLFSKAIVIPWLDDKARWSLINARNSESEHCHFQAIAYSISNLVLTIPQAFIHLGLAVPFVALSFLTMGTRDSINATAYVSIEQITNTPNVILQDLTRIVTCALKGTYSLASKVAEAPFRVASRLW